VFCLEEMIAFHHKALFLLLWCLVIAAVLFIDARLDNSIERQELVFQDALVGTLRAFHAPFGGHHLIQEADLSASELSANLSSRTVGVVVFGTSETNDGIDLVGHDCNLVHAPCELCLVCHDKRRKSGCIALVVFESARV